MNLFMYVHKLYVWERSPTRATYVYTPLPCKFREFEPASCYSRLAHQRVYVTAAVPLRHGNAINLYLLPFSSYETSNAIDFLNQPPTSPTTLPTAHFYPLERLSPFIIMESVIAQDKKLFFFSFFFERLPNVTIAEHTKTRRFN